MTYRSEQDEYLDRIGIGDPEPEDDGVLYTDGINPIVADGDVLIWGQRTVDTPQVWPDEQINNLHGLQHLDDWANLPQFPQPGTFLNTECSLEELTTYLTHLHKIGVIRYYTIDLHQPMEVISIRGHQHHYPQGHTRRTITIEYDSRNIVEWEVEQWSPGNVRMMMTSWELGFGRERD
jgi:hypothetical protein